MAEQRHTARWQPIPIHGCAIVLEGGNGDIVADCVTSIRNAGLPFGFYLTWNYNYLFNAGCCTEVSPPDAPGQIALNLTQYHGVMQDTIAEVGDRA